MKLKEYIENLRDFVKENPEALEMTVVYSEDGEGNEFRGVHYKPQAGNFNEDDRDWTPKENIENEPDSYEGMEINSVCIN